ncbi:hypothetical protein M0R45_008350 [Rubus argutus]|uniref:Uncharacterized protein n=1 Tax=Rubus argutus TaxID=59490 RepID=A0AAW1Y1A4_RUBAR
MAASEREESWRLWLCSRQARAWSVWWQRRAEGTAEAAMTQGGGGAAGLGTGSGDGVDGAAGLEAKSWAVRGAQDGDSTVVAEIGLGLGGVVDWAEETSAAIGSSNGVAMGSSDGGWARAVLVNWNCR